MDCVSCKHGNYYFTKNNNLKIDAIKGSLFICDKKNKKVWQEEGENCKDRVFHPGKYRIISE